jgi:hypothetical protein
MKRLGYAMAASAVAAAALTAAPGTSASAAPSVNGIPCRGAVSNSTPPDFTTVRVFVHSFSHASVTTIAHFKTGVVVATGKTGAKGNAAIAYLIGNAKPGFKVAVSIYVVQGPHNGNCTTTFTPRKPIR